MNKTVLTLCASLVLAVHAGAARAADPQAAAALPATGPFTVLDLNAVRAHPGDYPWFEFKPKLKKLILAGAPDTEHISILWYTSPNGSVGLHYHAKTESVFAIDGSQADDKGVYPTGTLYFNPPGSGHAITNSSGFFILAYASPPDFAGVAKIGPYTPVHIDTAAADFDNNPGFRDRGPGVRVYDVALDPAGGMRSEFIRVAQDGYQFKGNYLLVLKGVCVIEGAARAAGMLVVARDIAPRPMRVAATRDGVCLALGVAFTATPAAPAH